MDRNVYGDHALTVPLQPSETEERLMVRLLAFALNVPADDHQGALQLARGMADADEPDLWQKDLTDQLLHWIEVGQPTDERRLAKACGRARRVTLYCYSHSAHIWYAGIANKITRLRNLEIWQLPFDQSQALAALAAFGSVLCDMAFQGFSASRAQASCRGRRLIGRLATGPWVRSPPSVHSGH